MSDDLAQMVCEPCRGGIPPMTAEEITPWLKRLGSNWELVDNHHLRKTFAFDTFQQSLDFVVRIGAMAEQLGHHPEVHLSFRQVHLELWTHKIDGLAEADFIAAAKFDTCAQA